MKIITLVFILLILSNSIQAKNFYDRALGIEKNRNYQKTKPPPNYYIAPMPYPQCAQEAVFCGLTAIPLYKVRIAIGLNNVNKRHAQAQAFIDNEWMFLVLKNCRVRIIKKLSWFRVEKYMTLPEYFDRVREYQNGLKFQLQ